MSKAKAPVPANVSPPWPALARALIGDLARYAGRRGGLAMVLVAAVALIEGIGLVLLVPIFALSIGAGAGTGWVGRQLQSGFEALNLQDPQSRLIVLLLVFAFLLVLRLVLSTRRDLLLNEIQIGFVDSRRLAVMKGMAEAPWEVASRLEQAEGAQVLVADAQRLGTTVRLLQYMLVAMMMLTAQCLAALLVSPLLALFCFGLLALAALALRVTLLRAHELGESVANANMATMQVLLQFFGGLKLAMSQGLQQAYVDEMKQVVRGVEDRQLEVMRANARRQMAVGVTAILLGGAVCVAGLTLLAVPVAAVVGLLLIMARITGPAILIQHSGQQFAQVVPVYWRQKQLEERTLGPARAIAAATAEAPIALETGIVFDRVTYDHVAEGDRSRPALLNCSAQIRAGAFVGLTGPSGAGKTTFVDLLVGLISPDEGVIRVDDVPLAASTLPSWRRQLSYVGQDPYFFPDSVRRNLAWANPDAGEAALWAALEAAGAGPLVRQLPHGLDSVIGERGLFLSGGERQRLALARALVRKPRLLVLDEATNAIDLAGERALLDTLLALAPRPTILMIAHRRESLAGCDQLLLLSEGRLRPVRSAEEAFAAIPAAAGGL